MTDRLDPICFLPPEAGRLWTGPPPEFQCDPITRTDQQQVQVDVPLFWYDPPWYRLPMDVADLIASAVAGLGIPVSALRSDMAAPGFDPMLHSPLAADEDEDIEPDSNDVAPTFLPRMVPYRPARYGLSDRDFDGPCVIDVRISATRDATGRFAFPPEQIQRWESTPDSEPLAGGGWVASATFPPDVKSLSKLEAKLHQLRQLSPTAAVFVSVDPFRIEDELQAVLGNSPDGIIVRLDQLNLDGLQLALLTKQIREWVDRRQPGLPVWLVPGEVSADDAAKLVALGASAIAIDHWGDNVLQEVANGGATTSSTTSSFSRAASDQIYDVIDSQIAGSLDRVVGLLHAMKCCEPGKRLGSLSAKWADALKLPTLPIKS